MQPTVFTLWTNRVSFSVVRYAGRVSYREVLSVPHNGTLHGIKSAIRQARAEHGLKKFAVESP